LPAHLDYFIADWHGLVSLPHEFENEGPYVISITRRDHTPLPPSSRNYVGSFVLELVRQRHQTMPIGDEVVQVRRQRADKTGRLAGRLRSCAARQMNPWPAPHEVGSDTRLGRLL